MNIPRKWLADYTKIDATSKEYEDAMTMSGSKVEATHEPSEEIKNVVVGLVETIERHPDSDHLWVCSMNVGRDEPVTIVTGAQNVRAGDKVPVALHKSLLPGGKKIEKGKIRGIKSEGMLCSLGELNLDLHDFPYADEDGIFILQEECAPGDDIRPIIGADESIVEFEITSNRPDCLSVIGLARESAVTFGTKLEIPVPSVKGSGGDINDHLSIKIANPDLCTRYTARMIKNIKIEPSPKWMRLRLRAAGVRPINNIVDITNYVMLEYGQPMHAFDYACIDGNEIIVRTATPGEVMKTLDGTPRTLTSDMLLIADTSKPVGVAGVMGGENSEITENTKYAVFESATFNGVSVRKTATALGMRTDASSRFEKGLDIENTLPSVERACELVELLGAGEVIDGIIDVRAAMPQLVTLSLQPDKINKLIGADISESFMKSTLEQLGFGINGDIVTVPSWRRDVEHYSDLAEEVARFYGYEVIEPTLHNGSHTGGFTTTQSQKRKAGQICRSMGFNEICTYSFIGRTDLDKAGISNDSPLREGIVILNPLGEDTSFMRTTPLPSMLGALSKNRGHRNPVARLYELATIYLNKGEQLPDERVIVTLGAYGDCDFYTIKGVVETILADMRITEVRYVATSDNTSYHPGRTAEIYYGSDLIGVIGQINPSVASTYGLPDTYAAELDFALMLAHKNGESQYEPLPRFPAIIRDIALVCDKSIASAELSECISRSGGKLLRSVKPFDVYTGSQVPDGKKSIAFSLTLRADDKTLTDEEADEVIKSILNTLSEEMNAAIR